MDTAAGGNPIALQQQITTAITPSSNTRQRRRRVAEAIRIYESAYPAVRRGGGGVRGEVEAAAAADGNTAMGTGREEVDLGAEMRRSARRRINAPVGTLQFEEVWGFMKGRCGEKTPTELADAIRSVYESDMVVGITDPNSRARVLKMAVSRHLRRGSHEAEVLPVADGEHNAPAAEIRPPDDVHHQQQQQPDDDTHRQRRFHRRGGGGLAAAATMGMTGDGPGGVMAGGILERRRMREAVTVGRYGQRLPLLTDAERNMAEIARINNPGRTLPLSIVRRRGGIGAETGGLGLRLKETTGIGNDTLGPELADSVSVDQIERMFETIRPCPMCTEVITGDKKFCAMSPICSHSMCKSCMDSFVKVCLESNSFPVMCPFKSCNVPVDPRCVSTSLGVTECGIALLPEHALRFNSLQLKYVASVHPSTVSETSSCPFCYIMVTGRPSPDVPMARCTNPFCSAEYCTNCGIAWHRGTDCRSRSIAESEDASKSMIESLTKPCPRCSRRSEHFKDHSCHHLKCPCGFEYCYSCLGPWSEHAVGKRLSHCPMFCNDSCKCPVCCYCKPGKPCSLCSGNCPTCRQSK